MEHKMISSYWNSSYLKVVSPGGCIPRRSSSLEVVFHIFKMFKIILRCSGVDLQILQSKFSWFPAISLLVWMVVAQDMWRWRRRICGGRAAGEINNKANSAQLSWDWGWAWQKLMVVALQVRSLMDDGLIIKCWRIYLRHF